MGILVVAEHRQGKIQDPTWEVLGKAGEVAASAHTEVKAVLMGDAVSDLASELARYPVNGVLVVEDPRLKDYTPEGYGAALAALLEHEEAELVLTSHTATGYEFLPRVAADMDRPLVTAAMDVSLVDGLVVATRTGYNGKVAVEIAMEGGGPAFVTLRPATFTPPEPGPKRAPVTPVDVDLSALQIRREVQGYEKPESEDVDIAEADVVVTVGRGIKKKENIRLAEDLAAALGGVVGASRPIVDNGWLPRSRQVGSSGKTVAPKLYVACGVSGAMQHLTGMKGSQTIVAINIDPTAPIFSVAHYGAIGDLLEIIPSLLRELEKA
ncbi:MAG: electron transfer flavoprotein subunit alpha/FixB family protein [Candidatus Thermoplasmatota archaeon]|nr:electron transfer flavoprotein subunit alpha/FixB family protein [Candidatus Thermoplasmatota archaeon]